MPGFAYGPGYVYFVTTCAAERGAPFEDARLAERIVSTIKAFDSERRARVHCYCLMPDHLHLVLSCVPDGPNLSGVMRDLKARTTWAAKRLGARIPLWQPRFYDHIARTEEDLFAACEYVMNNPVRADLVAEAGQWPYSGMLSPLPL